MMYDRTSATSLTLDELHRVLEEACMKNNVNVEIVTIEGEKLMGAASVPLLHIHYKDEDDEDGEYIPPSPDDKSARKYELLGPLTVHADGSVVGHRETESWFTIPDYYSIRHIDRVDGADEQTLAMDCEYVYYVVLKNGITIRIEI